MSTAPETLTGRPEQTRLGPAAWARQNLFPNPRNAAMTIVFGAVLAYALYRLIRLVFVTGRWEIVRRNLTNFMVGNFPRDELWRPWAAVFLIAIAIGFQWGSSVAKARAARLPGQPSPATARDVVARVWPLALLALVVVALSPDVTTVVMLVALAAVTAGARAAGERIPEALQRRSWVVPALAVLGSFAAISWFGGVSFARWQGLLLTLTAAAGGIILSFPFGVLLALGRRSSLPVVRAICVAYIELIRGVPLITLLFMGFLMLGFLLPPGTPTPSIAARGMVAIVLFTAAYLAEVVRGGLQAVPRGQIEAAQALGLTTVKTTRLIVLPQALRAVIPAIVGQFISLFKDTSLLGFIGLVELLQIASQATAQPAFLGQGVEAEALMFASLIYWTGSYWMSKTSQRLERRLGVGER